MTSEVDIAFWLINNVKEDPDGSIFYTELLNKLKDEHTMVSHRNLGERIMTEFPHVKKGRQLNKLTYLKETIYKGISFITTPEQFTSFKLNELLQHLPPSVMLISQTNESVKVGMSSDVIRNKSIMLKVITFTQTSWKLSVTDRDINLSKLKLSNLFECNTKFLTTILKLVKDLNLCHGESHYIEENLSNLARKDVVSKVGNENYHENIVRSKYCEEIVKLSSVTGKCKRCMTDIYITELKEDTDKNIPLNQADSKDISIILEKVFPNASEEMQLLLRSQHDALTTKCRKGMRWSKKVISLCLSMWVRSPQTYKDLSESQALILPSGRQLARYKNKIPQITGLQDEAHKKQIKMRKDKKDSGFQGQNLSTINFGKDASEGKMALHRRLQSNVESGKFCLEKKMTKEKLKVLCLAYSVAFNSKMTKKVLSNVLSDVIAKSDTMPNPQAVSEPLPGPSVKRTKIITSVQDTSPETQPAPKRTEKVPAVVDKGKRTSDTMPNPQAVIEQLPGPSVKRKKIITSVQDISPETQPAPKRTEKAPGGKKKKNGKQSKGKVIRTKQVEWPCGKCEEACKDNSVCCDGCDTWYHYNCVNLQGDESGLDSDEWFCEDCKSHMS